MDRQELKEALKEYISANKLYRALGILEEICHESAEHHQEEWEDDLASEWWKAKSIIGAATGKVPSIPS